VPIEIINREIARGRIHSVLFDFDGTLSLIREGWQQVMIPMMVELLLETPDCEVEAEAERVVTDYVTELTGKQTIYQMLRLQEEVQKRGGQPRDALEYKQIYLSRLWDRIRHRVAALESGEAPPEDFLVPGSHALLAGMHERGVTMYLASGTDRADVLREVRALGLSEFFGDRVYGALDRYWEFSKAMLIEEIIQTHALHGPELAGLGDGYVEIENVKSAGGIAVGVASDEARRQGVNEWKRQRLIRAGADLIVPDYRDHEGLLKYLWAEGE